MKFAPASGFIDGLQIIDQPSMVAFQFNGDHLTGHAVADRRQDVTEWPDLATLHRTTGFVMAEALVRAHRFRNGPGTYEHSDDEKTERVRH